jgi:hypothetical protein
VDPQALVWLAPHIPVFALRCFPPPITFLLWYVFCGQCCPLMRPPSSWLILKGTEWRWTNEWAGGELGAAF